MLLTRLLSPFLASPARHLLRLASDACYRRYVCLDARVGGLPRYRPCSVVLGDWKLAVPDSASFLSAFRHIFVEEGYALELERKDPYIVDLGANIGLSVLYFKTAFPSARISAFEADPAVFAALERNIHGNGFTDVELYNKAAWHQNGTLSFSSEGADGGRVARAGDSANVEVEALDISRFLAGKQVDLLKMDIEGAEVEVLLACGEALASVQRVFVEYHSRIGAPQRLPELLELLRSAGFRYHIHSALNARRPFVALEPLLDYDMLLNIYAWKESANGS